MLFSQYFYYSKTATPTVSAFSRSRSRAGSLGYRTSRERASSHYRTLSSAAANVANIAAVLASQRNEPPSSTYVPTRWSRRSLDGLLDNDRRREDDGDVDEDALAMLADSTHSEWSGRQKHVFWSKERHPSASHSRTASRHDIGSSPIPPSLQITTSPLDDFDPLARGRSLQRSNFSLPEQEGPNWRRSEEGSQLGRSSRVSRRSATMVFMSAWTLFGLGTLGMRAYGGEGRAVIQPGRVLSSSSFAPLSLLSPSATHENQPLTTVDLVFDIPPYERVPVNRPPAVDTSLEHVIGRISAWTCTTLYLTSRLPQIWKNVRV
jgi:solute carrier family 66 (lysosomal lysine-arginine transporter), member 1